MSICLDFENSVIKTIFILCSIVLKNKFHTNNINIAVTEK